MPIKSIKVLNRETNGTAKRFTVTSATDARRHYIVTRRRSTWMCSCPFYKFHAVPKPMCKHMKAVR
jgi:hypothetical protein